MAKPPYRNARRRARAGLSLLEVAVGLSVTGSLLACFVPTFLEHVRLSKVSEATDQLERLQRAAASYYAEEHQVGGRVLRSCLPESAKPTPALPSIDKVLVDFAADDLESRPTWHALGFTGEEFLRYSYSVEVPEAGCAPRAALRAPAVITFRAEGDLDADGVKSLIERSATLSPDQRELVPMPLLHVERRVE